MVPADDHRRLARDDGDEEGPQRSAGEDLFEHGLVALDHGRAGESLEDYIAKVRQLAATARPPQIAAATAVENRDSQLRTARAILTVAPTSENHRRVAEAYARLGILDQAFDHFNAALRMNGTDAAAYDGLARVWRDWGYPHLGLGDAHRAVYYAPLSPVARNTLGTVLLALGQNREAQAAFELALVLDANAKQR